MGGLKLDVELPWTEPQCGRARSSMKTNVLLHKADLGKVKKCTFQSPPDDKIFGVSHPPDIEGAREVSTVWKKHRPDEEAEAGPDFRVMNKLSAIRGVTTSRQQGSFRAANMRTLAIAEHSHRPATLPSTLNPDHAFGCPSTHKTMEQIRVYGKENPGIKQLIQGAHAWDWIKKQQAAAENCHHGPKHRAASPTRASAGHQRAALLKAFGPGKSAGDAFKMPRFRSVPPKVVVWTK